MVMSVILSSLVNKKEMLINTQSVVKQTEIYSKGS